MSLKKQMFKNLFKKQKKEPTHCKMCSKELKEDIRRLRCGHKFHGRCVDHYTYKYDVYSCWKCGQNHS